MPILKVLGQEINIAQLGTEAFNGNTAGVTGNRIVIANQRFVNGQILTYSVSAGNTTVNGLTNGANYYSVYANNSSLGLALTLGGANLTINTACTSTSETGHKLFAANNFGNAQVVRVFNLAAANLVRISNASGNEYATITVTNSEVLYLNKAATDTVWCNGQITINAAPIVLKG